MSKTTFELMRWLEEHCGDLAPYILTVNQSKSKEGDYYDIVMALVVPESDIVPSINLVSKPEDVLEPIPLPEKFTVPSHPVTMNSAESKPVVKPQPQSVQVRRKITHQPMPTEDIQSLLGSEDY